MTTLNNKVIKLMKQNPDNRNKIKPAKGRRLLERSKNQIPVGRYNNLTNIRSIINGIGCDVTATTGSKQRHARLLAAKA